MAKRNTKKRTYKSKRKYKKSFKKTWQKFQSIFLQRLGCLTLFAVVFGGLFVILVVQIINFSSDYFEQAAIEQQHQAFFNQLVPTAQRLQRQYGVLPSVSLGQAALESDYGRSDLAVDHHNLYGVKTDADDTNGVNMPTLEYYDNEYHEQIERFKVYDSWDESMEEHAQLIYYGTSWDPNFYQAVLEGNTYREQAMGLQEAGYATDPYYADKVIAMIEKWDLDQYDQPVIEN